ncbi:putative membrane protein YccC [Nocardioides daedukensis]|uniref:Putative membrane protein YccC n=1 Tax=Nocardioides daedukensis TaxID=634462 RepID=A0A7Y9S3L7_9ACTN|nr:hypothetical protein [Nocardioides daedukensis]NYG59094.1 putative membrane protein YccC [Nocardioides daedukensis]
MENESRPPVHEEQARAALASIGAARAGLADRLVTPWYYHPVLGLLMAVMVLFYGLERFHGSPLRILAALGVILGSLGLTTYYAHRTGIAVTKPLGRRSKAMMVVMMVGLVAPLLWLLITQPGDPWVFGTALVIFCFTVVIGRGYDAALRADLRAGTPGAGTPGAGTPGAGTHD